MGYVLTGVLTFIAVLIFLYFICPSVREDLKAYFDLYATKRYKAKTAGMIEEYLKATSLHNEARVQELRTKHKSYQEVFDALDAGFKQAQKQNDEISSIPALDDDDGPDDPVAIEETPPVEHEGDDKTQPVSG